MLERLSQLIKIRQLSASQFADEIGVQRSSVSHVLSGRNKPSLDFITKVALRYPDINTEWLLTGRGQMTLQADFQEEAVVTLDQQAATSEDNNRLIEEDIDEIEEKVSRIAPRKEKTGRDKSHAGSTSIEKIIIFYNNGSFTEYSPKD